jgi:chemotaxis protein histidine kinase CheA
VADSDSSSEATCCTDREQVRDTSRSGEDLCAALTEDMAVEDADFLIGELEGFWRSPSPGAFDVSPVGSDPPPGSIADHAIMHAESEPASSPLEHASPMGSNSETSAAADDEQLPGSPSPSKQANEEGEDNEELHSSPSPSNEAAADDEELQSNPSPSNEAAADDEESQSNPSHSGEAAADEEELQSNPSPSNEAAADDEESQTSPSPSGEAAADEELQSSPPSPDELASQATVYYDALLGLTSGLWWFALFAAQGLHEFIGFSVCFPHDLRQAPEAGKRSDPHHKPKAARALPGSQRIASVARRAYRSPLAPKP